MATPSHDVCTRRALASCLALMALACGQPQHEITSGNAAGSDQQAPSDADGEPREDTDDPDPNDGTPPGREPALELPGEPVFTDPIQHQGRGDQVIDLDIPRDEPAIAHLRHEGSTYLRATTRTDDGRTIERLVRADGPYAGIRPFNLRGQPPATLDIAADGDWTVEIRPLHDLRTATGPIGGSGDEVLLFDVEADAIHLTHEGRSTLRVVAWGQRRAPLLGAVGPYDDTLELPGDVAAVEIVADGTWTLTPTTGDEPASS